MAACLGTTSELPSTLGIGLRPPFDIAKANTEEPFWVGAAGLGIPRVLVPPRTGCSWGEVLDVFRWGGT